MLTEDYFLGENIDSIPIIIYIVNSINIKEKTEQRSFQITAKLISRACGGIVRMRAVMGGGDGGEPITGDSISREYLQLMYRRKPLT